MLIFEIQADQCTLKVEEVYLHGVLSFACSLAKSNQKKMCPTSCNNHNALIPAQVDDNSFHCFF